MSIIHNSMMIDQSLKISTYQRNHQAMEETAQTLHNHLLMKKINNLKLNIINQ